MGPGNQLLEIDVGVECARLEGIERIDDGLGVDASAGHVPAAGSVRGIDERLQPRVLVDDKDRKRARFENGGRRPRPL